MGISPAKIKKGASYTNTNKKSKKSLVFFISVYSLGKTKKDNF